MWVDCWRLWWSVVHEKVPKFASGISLSGKFVWDFFVSGFQFFKSGWIGSPQSGTLKLDLRWRNFKMASWLIKTSWVWMEKFFEKGEMLPIDWFLGYMVGIWTRDKALPHWPHVLQLVTPKRSLPGAGWGIINKSWQSTTCSNLLATGDRIIGIPIHPLEGSCLGYQSMCCKIEPYSNIILNIIGCGKSSCKFWKKKYQLLP